MRPHTPLYCVLLTILCTPVLLFSQNSSTDTISGIFKEPLLFTEVNPLHSFGIFTLDAPLYVGTFKEKGGRFSAGYSMGNTWHPQATVYYPKGLTPNQRTEVNNLFYTKRPAYFEEHSIETETKTLSTDGILQNLNLSYLLQLERKGAFLFTLNTHLLSGGDFPLFYLAGDHFIEQFHDVLGQVDNFGRRLYPSNKAHIEFIDENKNTIRINKGDAFLGTLDTHYWLPIWRKSTPLAFYTLQGGAHLGIPLNSYYPKVSGGVSAALFTRQQIGGKTTLDIALDGLVTHHSLISLKETANIIDRDVRNSFKFYFGFNFYNPKKDKTFFAGMLTNYQDAYLKGSIFSTSQDEYQDLGVSYLRAGDVWEGEEITSSYFPLTKLTPASMYFFSIKTYILLGTRTKNGDFTFTLGEDILSVNNAPDIQYGVSYTFKM
ncbi:hypothetical protein NBRC110019_25080 [Neptunitalea chrysea]|uniref:Uncharacterized protein n=1 Tax=Neptunitalea chrysea TaxID=1647581 RepID=A0A9W6EW72_9FLAO|nr:hypothetical protein [Neptunitalea chrysea]GLB53467.1 hypothetical protein NBRC110019_25080 [Neptunitalea chrysea]